MGAGATTSVARRRLELIAWLLDRGERFVFASAVVRIAGDEAVVESMRKCGFIGKTDRRADWISAIDAGACRQVCRMEVEDDEEGYFARCPLGRCPSVDLDADRLRQLEVGVPALVAALANANGLNRCALTEPPHIVLGSCRVGDVEVLFIWARRRSGRSAIPSVALAHSVLARGFGAVVVLNAEAGSVASPGAMLPNVHLLDPLGFIDPQTLRFDRSRLHLVVEGHVARARAAFDHPEPCIEFSMDADGHLEGRWSGQRMGNPAAHTREEQFLFQVCRLAAGRLAEPQGLGWVARAALHLERNGVFNQKAKTLDALRSFVADEDEERAIQSGDQSSGISGEALIRTAPKTRGSSSPLRLAVRPENVAISLDPDRLRLRGRYPAQKEAALRAMIQESHALVTEKRAC